MSIEEQIVGAAVPTKRPRVVPSSYYAADPSYRNPCTILRDLRVSHQAVTISRTTSGKDAPAYSDAELRLWIAEMEVAKEDLMADIDRHIAMLREILAAPLLV